MRRQLIAFLAGGFLVGAGGFALAHHSFAMFDSDNPLELVGEVQEFKFTSPHTFIILRVKGKDGNVTVWSLEGQSPSALVRDGWSSKAINPGDEVIDEDRSATQRRARRGMELKQDYTSGMDARS